MIRISEERFRELVTEAVDSLPERYGQNIENVVFIVEREPTPEQRDKIHLRGDALLFGLYEGVPLTKRGSGQTFLMPDRITLFMDAILLVSSNMEELRDHIRHTVWHEVAHYFGLGHDRIEQLDRKRKTKEEPSD